MTAAELPAQCPLVCPNTGQAIDCRRWECRYHLEGAGLRGPQVVQIRRPGDACALAMAARGPASYTEIAARFGVSPHTVKAIMRAALKKYRKFLIENSPVIARR